MIRCNLFLNIQIPHPSSRQTIDAVTRKAMDSTMETAITNLPPFNVTQIRELASASISSRDVTLNIAPYTKTTPGEALTKLGTDKSNFPTTKNVEKQVSFGHLLLLFIYLKHNDTIYTLLFRYSIFSTFFQNKDSLATAEVANSNGNKGNKTSNSQVNGTHDSKNLRIRGRE